jgi:hypothetical protein
MHDDDNAPLSFRTIRERALWAMKQEEARSDTNRADTARRVFLRKHDLDPPRPGHGLVHQADTEVDSFPGRPAA